jgi:hypothetical protein
MLRPGYLDKPKHFVRQRRPTPLFQATLVIPAKAGIHGLSRGVWIPAFAGMTRLVFIRGSAFGCGYAALGLSVSICGYFIRVHSWFA